MSSEISTKGADTPVPPGRRALRRARPESSEHVHNGTGIPRAADGLQPWQFFVLAGLGCATAGTFIARGQGVTPIILTTVLMAGAALVGLAVLRTFRPLVSPEDDRTTMVGQRTRVALEREKLLTLKTIKELEFDHAMGKLSDADWQEMSTRLRARAARLMRQLDAASGYRDQIERDLSKRIGEGNARLKDTPPRTVRAAGAPSPRPPSGGPDHRVEHEA